MLDFGSACQVMDGLMLGDGNLQRWQGVRARGGAIYSMKQSKRTILISDHIRWEQWIVDNAFAALGIPTCWHCPKVTYYKGYPAAYLRTCRSPRLVGLYNEWYKGGEWAHSDRTNMYIRGATKRLPERLMSSDELPALTLVHWFLGDGGSSWFYHEGAPSNVSVTFSTHCFTEEEVYHLMAMLNNMGVDTSSPTRVEVKRGSGLAIRVSAADGNVNRLMDLVEPHVMEIFAGSVGPSYKGMVKRRPS